jgi:hypothetical protein
MFCGNKITILSKSLAVEVPDISTSSVFQNRISQIHLNIAPTSLKFTENNHILGT